MRCSVYDGIIIVFSECKAVYIINRRADSVEKLIFDSDNNGAQPERLKFS